jgi:hypothetical protein
MPKSEDKVNNKNQIKLVQEERMHVGPGTDPQCVGPSEK